MRAWRHKLGGHRKEVPKSPKLSVQPCEPPALLSFRLKENKRENAKETREEREEMESVPGCARH